jgi:PleD family two-component response regulator
VLIVLEKTDVDGEAVALARHLRELPATHAVPLVLVYVEDERLMRSTALNVGVDDCFGIWTPHGQILARLDALFWRIEVGRRAASMSGDKRLEIDNFMVLLDAVREDIRDSASGSLALIYAIPSNNKDHGFDKQARDRALAEAHGFFKLNLRRIDAVGFYGPTTLLIYMPRLRTHESTEILMTLRATFLEGRVDSDLAIGVASFPDESTDVESLIERAEAAAAKARALAATGRTNASQTGREVKHSAPPQPPAPPIEQPTPSPIQVDAYLSSHSLVESSVSPVVRESPVSRPEEFVATSASQAVTSKVNDAEVSRQAAEQAAARERERRKRGANIPRRLLLTVSDAARMAQLNALVRSAGYEARTAFDGQQALDLLRIESPDVLLLDYELRGIDGLEMLRRLRKQTNGKLTVPVVMLLPPMQVMARREALELGASGIVAMPYDPAELLDSVRLAGNSE